MTFFTLKYNFYWCGLDGFPSIAFASFRMPDYRHMAAAVFVSTAHSVALPAVIYTPSVLHSTHVLLSLTKKWLNYPIN